jgi:hypothetical protein
MRMRLIVLFIALAAGAFALGRWSTHRDDQQDRPRAHIESNPRSVATMPSRGVSVSHAVVPALTASDIIHDANAQDDDPIASYEDMMYAQPDLLAASLARLRPQTPGKIDLYALGFAGDGEQNVFRNEVDYLPKLLAQRFDADGRVMQLIDSPQTFATVPLATRTNLYEALAGIATKMDVNEDILLLFLTSHGSEDHQLAVVMGSMPLDQLTPDDIRDALDAAHIRWRVIVVSACYSGGFIPALKDPHTMIITAARGDRTSFGCGNDSQITWFGKAFLTEALNQTTDFHDAYLRASTTIAGWERRDGETPSEPQYWAGTEIQKKLDAWRATLPSAAAVPFVPASVATREHRRAH